MNTIVWTGRQWVSENKLVVPQEGDIIDVAKCQQYWKNNIPGNLYEFEGVLYKKPNGYVPPAITESDDLAPIVPIIRKSRNVK